MRAIIIAVMVQNKQIVKLRLLGLDEKLDINKMPTETIDVTPQQLYTAMKNMQIDIVNAHIKHGKLSGYGAQLSRYANIDTHGNLIGKSPLVVIGQLKSEGSLVGYLVSDYNGKVAKASIADTLQYSNNNGIANGKVVTRDGKEYISAIVDSYETIELPKKTKEEFKIWTIEEFKNYMDSHGLHYRIEGSTLYYVDDTIQTLVVPDGIVTILQLKEKVETSDAKNSNISIIVLPKSFRTMESYALQNLPKLHKIIFHPDIEYIDFSIIQYENNGNISFNIPKGIKVIDGHNNVEGKLNVDYSKYTQLEQIRNSCSSIEVEGDTIDVGHPTSISRSFTGIHTPLKKIVIPTELERISDSFYDLAVEEIDLSNAVNLRYIGGGRCFSNIKGLKRIDLSNCKSLLTIDIDCFSALPDLEEVILPDSLKGISSWVFSDCPKLVKCNIPRYLENLGERVFDNSNITEITLYDKLKRVSLSNSKITVNIDNNTYIGSCLLENVKYQEVRIHDTVEKFDYGCFRGSSFRFNVPSHLKYIDNLALYQFSGMDTLDLSQCKELKQIGGMSLEGSNFKNIILPDGLEKIGTRAFKDMHELTNLYMPASVEEIGARSFLHTGKGTGVGTTVYLHKGSKADAYCKKNGLRIRYVESIQEAMDEIGIDKDTEGLQSKKIARLNLLFGSDPKHGVLLDDRYINKAEELYKLYMQANAKVELPTQPLDTRKFVHIPFNKVLSPKYRKRVAQDCLSNIFNNYVNFITKVYPNDTDILKHDCFDFLDKHSMIKESTVLLQDDDRQIMLLNVDNFGIYLVIIGEYIEYCSMINFDGNNTLMSMEIYPVEYQTKPIEYIMGKGNAFPVCNRTFPNWPMYIASEVSSSATRQLTLVGIKMVKRDFFTDGSDSVNAYMLSIETGNVLQCEARAKTSLRHRISIDLIGIANIKEISNIRKLPIQWDKEIKESLINVEGTKEFKKIMLFGDKYMTELCSAPGAYDEPESCIEWEIAKALKDVQIDSLNGIRHEVIQMILDTAFFYPINKREESFKSLTTINRLLVENGKYTLALYKYTRNKEKYGYDMYNYTPKYLYVLVDNLAETPTVIKCYVGNLKLQVVMNRIRQLYDSAAKPEYYLDNEPGEIEDYALIQISDRSLVEYEGSYSLALGVNKASGVIFSLMIKANPTYGKRVYKLFRYKNLQEALRYSRYIVEDAQIEEKVFRFGEVIACMKRVSDNLDVTNVFTRVRDLIMNGYPNGYYIQGADKVLFNSAAKQRKRL